MNWKLFYLGLGMIWAAFCCFAAFLIFAHDTTNTDFPLLVVGIGGVGYAVGLLASKCVKA